MRLILHRTFAFALLFACTSTLAEAQQPSAAGLWATEGYGELYDVGADSVVGYEVTAVSCIPTLRAATVAPPAGAIGAFRMPDLPVTFEIFPGKAETDARLHIAFTASDRIMHRIVRKPAVCEIPTPDTPRSNFDVFAATWGEQYGFFLEKNVDWSAIVAANRGRVTDATTPEELFAIISGMIEPLHDAHSFIGAKSIDKQFGGVRRSSSFLATQAERQEGLGLVTAHLTQPLHGFCEGRLEFGMLGHAIGYLRIRGFAGYTRDGAFETGLAALEAALDTVFANARTWQGFVIDVRLNGGGADPYGLAMARRLTAVPYTAYEKQARSDPSDPTRWTEPQPSVVRPSTRPGFRGPVVELTGVQSISAAETFTQALMNRRPRVVRVGETTQGVFSDVLGRTLPNGWRFGLANERFVTDGRSYDNVGIEPDVVVESFTPAARATRRDAAIERALAILSAR